VLSTEKKKKNTQGYSLSINMYVRSKVRASESFTIATLVLQIILIEIHHVIKTKIAIMSAFTRIKYKLCFYKIYKPIITMHIYFNYDLFKSVFFQLVKVGFL